MENGIIKIKINNFDLIKKSFGQAPEKITENMSRAISRIIIKIEATAKREAPVNKQSGGGNLRQNIRSRLEGRATGVVEAWATYAIFVHEGTRPHIIRARVKKGLANRRTGQYFGKIVHHPGTKPNPFLQRAVEAEQNFIDNEFEKVLENIL